MTDSRFQILLVEDSPTDQLLAREALGALGSGSVRSGAPGRGTHLNVVSDGVEALAYLRNKSPYETAPRPDLILLDLNLPRKDGREVLADIKADVALKSIPIIVLTTSESHQDVRQAYALHANCYICKPVDFTVFQDAIRATCDYWFRIVRLPEFDPPQG
jgi:two-component system, chemotaxis family, response regulator Rcp1